MRRATLTMEELMAMALARSARSSTIWTMKDWRPGMSKALMRPWNALRARTSPMVMRLREREPRERERLQHGERLRPDQDLAAVDAIDEDAGDGREQEGGDLSGEADDAEQQRGAGEAIDEPDGGDARHPGADERDALAAEEEAEVAMAQRAPGVGEVARSAWSVARRSLLESCCHASLVRCIAAERDGFILRRRA